MNEYASFEIRFVAAQERARRPGYDLGHRTTDGDELLVDVWSRGHWEAAFDARALDALDRFLGGREKRRDGLT